MTEDQIKLAIQEQVLPKVITPEFLIDPKKPPVININKGGKFEVGGPEKESGMTGRKIASDTYGGWCEHGGAVLSGRDPSHT